MTNINITTVVAQLPYMQDVAHMQLTSPQMQQVFAAQMAQQAMRAKNEQVQKIEAQHGSEAISDEEDRKRRQGRPPQHKRHAAPEDEPEVMASNASPWLGHLLNKKV